MEDSQQDESQTLAGSSEANTPEPPPLELSGSSIGYMRDLQAALDEQNSSQDSGSLSSLKGTLDRWPASDQTRKPLSHVYHVLEGDYSKEGLLLQKFQPIDLTIIEALRKVSKVTDMMFFFALVWKIKEPGEDGAYDENNKGAGAHYIDYEDELHGYDFGPNGEDPPCEGVVMNYKVKGLYDDSGDLVVGSMPLDEDYWLKVPERFEHTAEENDDMVDVGLTAQHWYRKAAILILPRRNVVRVLANAYTHPHFKSIRPLECTVGSIVPQIEYWSEKLTRCASSSFYAKMLLETCEYHWFRDGDPSVRRGGRRIPLPRKSIVAVLSAALRANCVSLFERAAECHQGTLDANFFLWFCQWIQDRRCLSDSLTDEWLVQIQRFRKGICTAVKAYHWYSSITRVLGTLTSNVQYTGRVAGPILKGWVEGIVFDLVVLSPPNLSDIESRGVDGYLGVVNFLPDPAGCLNRGLLPQLREKRASEPFFLVLLSQLRFRVLLRRREVPVWEELFQEVAYIYLKDINFDDYADPQGFIIFLQESFRIDTAIKGHVRDLCLGKLGSVEVDNSSGEKLDQFWLPLIQELSRILETANVPVRDARFQRLVKAVLRSYPSKYMGERPGIEASNVRPLTGCDCVDCEPVNSFLADPDQKMARFPMSGISQAHVRTKLRESGVDCSTAELMVGPPHELMVKKTNMGLVQGTLEHQKRKRRVEEQISGIPNLGEILGKEDYEALVGQIRDLASGSKGS